MIAIELNQTQAKAGSCLSRARVAHVAHEVNRALRLKRPFIVSVAFVSEHQMKKLNRHHRGKNAVTDVLSFTLDEPELKGEILLCEAQAVRQAKQMGHSLQDECIFLLVHGLLHVFGYDHERSQDAQKMFPLQSRILTHLHVNPKI